MLCPDSSDEHRRHEKGGVCYHVIYLDFSPRKTEYVAFIEKYELISPVLLDFLLHYAQISVISTIVWEVSIDSRGP